MPASQLARRLITLLALGLAVPAVLSSAAAAEPGRPVSIRIRWGGGTPQAWSGQIELLPGGGGLRVPVEWRSLSGERDAAALAHDADGKIVVHQPRPIANDGVELSIRDWPTARLSVVVGPAATGGNAATLEVPVAEILAGPVQRQLDNEGNRLVVEPAADTLLHVEFATPIGLSATAVGDTLRRPGDTVRMRVTPLLLMKPPVGDVELRLRLSPARQDTVLQSRVIPLQASTPAAEPGAGAGAGLVPTVFAPVESDLTLPAEEGAYDLVLEAVERRGLRWNRQLASRRLQLVAIADEEPPPPVAEHWKIVYELDPGSPRLHERLRRMPGRSLPGIPRPSVPLPAMPLPSLSRPSLPRMPEMQLPNVNLPAVPLPSVNLPNVNMPSMSLPNVSSLVPRLGGLLATGHSTVSPHALGPMLSLPPATGPARPSWEAIVVPVGRPGVPHVVEIDYPTDQQATLGVCVLEADATGTAVEVRHAGGVEVAATRFDGPARLGTHRFVFWPTTRQPLVVIANPLAATPALVGRVRVLAGPASLPRATFPAAARRAGTPRQTLGLLPAADLTARFGGPGPIATDGGRPGSDWIAHLAAIDHSAESLLAHGLAGGLVTVYSGGVAAWPSRLTRTAAGWPVGETAASPEHDLLAATARVYTRAGLAFVPGLSFDAAVPALETLRAGPDSTGIACLGGDGRSRRLPGGVHYNILDPRVQRAVEEIVAEAARRLPAAPGVAGLAIMLPHDGWLHLPGVAWGLDDATFLRFLEAIGGTEEDRGDERFAARARLVSGSLREEWLAWRSGQVAAFHARLAAAVAGEGDRRLFLVPTTLFSSGDLARRFRPEGGGAAASADLLREIGLAVPPPAAGSRSRIVLVPPRVHAAGVPLADRSTVAAANQAAARAATATGSLAAALLSRPLAVNFGEVIPHGPFPSASLRGPCPLAIAPATAAGEPLLAAAVAANDVELLFDMLPPLAAPPFDATVPRGHEPLPAMPLARVVGVPEPLVVRSGVEGGVTWVELVNPGAAAVEATIALEGSATAVTDAASGGSLPLSAGRVTVPLAARSVRPLAIDGASRIAAVQVGYDDATRRELASAIERLRLRLGVLTAPQPLDVLDNPGFEIGLADALPAQAGPAVTGWELLQPRRGSLELVPGRPEEGAGGGRAVEFASRNGLATLRSNPFPAPKTGRISVAAWLRLRPGEPQPPLRIAIEGLEEGREYYRFAAVGGLTGGRPLTGEWSQFVLQIDDLDAGTVESLRVRFDLLGPGSVQLDDVRVFDLAFDEDQRNQIAQTLARIDHRVKGGELGAALLELDGHWPAFLQAFVSEAAVAALASEPAVEPEAKPLWPGRRQGGREQRRGWW